MKKFKRNVFRLTLIKGEKNIKVDSYAKLIKKYKPNAVELKGYVWVGFSQKRLKLRKIVRKLKLKD